MFQSRRSKLLLALGATLSAPGCAGDARVHLAAADSVDVLRAGIAQSLAEYHTDLAALDDQRRQAATDALIDRLRADAADETSADAFRQAMQRLDADREVAWQRYAASMDTVALLGEIASDLRRLAAESMSLNDEAQRYFTDLVKQYKDRKVQAAAEKIENASATKTREPSPAAALAERLMRSKTR